MHWDTSQSGTQRHFGRSCTTAGGEMIASVVGWVKHRRKALPSYLIDWRARFNCSYSPRHTVLFWIHQRLTAFTWTGINVPFLCWRDGDDLLLASIFFFYVFFLLLFDIHRLLVSIKTSGFLFWISELLNQTSCTKSIYDDASFIWLEFRLVLFTFIHTSESKDKLRCPFLNTNKNPRADWGCCLLFSNSITLSVLR